ncbi:MAG: tRNA-queuosine alpha-mannosyltransferase domain-containing protein [Anaerolineae bacterium]
MTYCILLIEPYYGGSHQAWVDGYTRHSQHLIEKLTMPAQFWKWRMQGGAVTMARQFQQLAELPDLIIASDMMDLSLFRAITRTEIPIALYFHENQLTYPQNQRQHHGWQYGFINYASALSADVLYFNSDFHLNSFFDELPRMLKHFGDYNELETIDLLRAKAQVLTLGLDLERFQAYRPSNPQPATRPLILWNHRWESDKNPLAFFKALHRLADDGFDFDLILAGENFRSHPTEFDKARERFGDRIRHYGFITSFADYAQFLWQTDYVISTAYQDFFGIAVAEAIYCGCIPILANRLNYPDLLPDDYHSACLFREGALYGHLRQHLLGNHTVDTSRLQAHIAQYDWSQVAPLYDATFARRII